MIFILIVMQKFKIAKEIFTDLANYQVLIAYIYHICMVKVVVKQKLTIRTIQI